MRSNGNRPEVKLKNEFCADGRHNYVQKILSFTILNKCYFVVTRSAGLVQLYEKQKTALSAIAYKLVKEWNSTVSVMDPVVAVGSFRNQFMYTCSNDGKLVIRDLINDDADDSVKTYLIDGPVSSIQIQPLNDNMRVLVAAGGQENELKMYDLDVGLSMASNLNRLYSVGISRPNMTTMIRLSNVLPDQRMPLRRNVFYNFSSFSEWKRLVPVFVSNLVDKNSETLISSNWILSVCFINNGKQMMCAGTQFGELLIFNASDSYQNEDPERILHLSQFSINTLHVFGQGRYLLYTDTMSKIGVMDVYTYEIVNFYDFLKIGPTVVSKVYSCPESVLKLLKSTTLSKFKPIYVVAATIDGNIVFYKLHDNNESELKLCISHAGIIPDMDILEVDAYNVLEEAFGEMHDIQGVHSKRRKRDTGKSQFLQFGSGHRGHDLRGSSESSANHVEDIKSLNILN